MFCWQRRWLPLLYNSKRAEDIDCGWWIAYQQMFPRRALRKRWTLSALYTCSCQANSFLLNTDMLIKKNYNSFGLSFNFKIKRHPSFVVGWVSKDGYCRIEGIDECSNNLKHVKPVRRPSPIDLDVIWCVRISENEINHTRIVVGNTNRNFRTWVRCHTQC